MSKKVSELTVDVRHLGISEEEKKAMVNEIARKSDSTHILTDLIKELSDLIGEDFEVWKHWDSEHLAESLAKIIIEYENKLKGE